LQPQGLSFFEQRKHRVVQRDLQLEAMRIYQTLVDIREDWGGKLVLGCGPGCADTGAPAAVSIAGGTTLVIDSDAAAMKSAMRAGYLDFVVNTLDEALRTLKNEIRQKHPLSVGLIADTESTLAEVVERGLQPELLLTGGNRAAQPTPQSPSIRELQARGMAVRRMAVAEDREPREPSPPGRKLIYLPAANAVELKAIDERLKEIFPPSELVRRRWVQQVPKYLREARSGGRWIWLTPEEEERFGA
jgi:urocanate hydratase